MNRRLRHSLTASALASALLLAYPAPALNAQTAAFTTAPVSTNGTVPARVTEKVDDARRATLTGHVRPFLKFATIQGAVEPSRQTGALMLMLSRTPQQQADLDAFVEQAHDKNSALFHKWLTPAEFGARFQPADTDVQAVRTWLQSKGFNVLDVVPSKTFISFQGTVGQLQSAFHTQIHHITLNGEEHMATINEPEIPAALASVIGGINKLDDFGPKPLIQKAGVATTNKKTGKTTLVAGMPHSPQFTDDADGLFLVGPQDFYTVYNETPLLKAGITGAGQTIAVIEEVQVNPADVTSFRSQFGLPTYPSTPNSTAGGVNYLYGSSSGLNGYASCTALGTLASGASSGEEGEADLDLEWSGAVAPNATVDFVACGGANALGSLGIDHAAQYVVNYLSGTVVAASMSYGECENEMNTTSLAYYNNQWQQFAAEGITPIVSSGDSGAEGCYQNQGHATIRPPSTNGFGSSAYNVSAGGTDFGDVYESKNYANSPSETWWSDTNGTGYSSAVTYIPETTWGGYCSNPLFDSYLQAAGSTSFGSDYTPSAICSSSASQNEGYTAVVGGSGGISTYTPIPTWQSVYGVGRNSVSSTFRNTPDVSLFAASGFWGHALPFCESDNAPCDYTVSDNIQNSIAGGTSFVAPQLAGFMALVSQKTGQSQGQANYTFYNLGAQEYGTTATAASSLVACSGSNVALGQRPPASCYFNDISNDMPSLQGGAITAGIYEPCLATDIDCFKGTGTTYGVNVVPGTTATDGILGYTVSPGYDDATGLGSLNIYGIVEGWTNTTSLPTTTLSLAANPTYSHYGQSVTLTATLSPYTASGHSTDGEFVTFLNNGVQIGKGTLASGVATLALSSLPAGYNSLTASYFSDNNLAASKSTPLSYGVITTLTVTASPSTLTTTQSTQLTVTAATGGAAATNTVNFIDNANGANLGNCNMIAGTCSINVSGANLPAQTQTVQANSVADSTYVASTSAPVSLVVTNPTPTPSAITSPAPGSKLTGASQTFSWSAGSGIEWQLLVGNAVGAENYFHTSSQFTTSVNVTGLPTNSSKVYVRLLYRVNDAWQSIDYTYTAYAPVPVAATLTSPAPSSTLPASSVTFGWTAGTGITEYELYVGTTQGASNLYNSKPIYNTTTANVTGLPTTGQTLYVRLWSYVSNAWQYHDYTYTASTPANAVAATLTTPAPSSRLSGPSVTFGWTTGTGVSQYQLYIGTTQGASNFYSSGQLYNTTSKTVNGLPTSGQTIYVRLWSYVANAWQYKDYTYTAASTPTPSVSSKPE